MNRAFKTEYYPDMTDKDYGKRVLLLHCTVTNGKRFKELTHKEKCDLFQIIERFEKSLTAFKNELISDGDSSNADDKINKNERNSRYD